MKTNYELLESVVITMYSLERQNKSVTLNDLSDLMQIHLSTLRTFVYVLREKQLVTMVGSKKNASYKLTTQGKKIVESHQFSLEPKRKSTLKEVRESTTVSIAKYNKLAEENVSLRKELIVLQNKLKSIKSLM